MARRVRDLLALALVLAAAGCGSASSGTIATAPASAPAADVQDCPPHGGLRLSVRNMTCAAALQVTQAFGPSSATPRFRVRGFGCTHAAGAPVHCVESRRSFTLTGGE